MTVERERPGNGDVVIWKTESTAELYWVRRQSRGSATPLFSGMDAWAQAGAQARAWATHDETIWIRHTDGRFEKLAEADSLTKP